MIAIVIAAAIGSASPAFEALEEHAEALDRCAMQAARLEHTGPASAEHDRRVMAIVLAEADAVFLTLVRTPGALADDTAADLALALGEANQALRDWSSGRDALDRRAMRSAARQLREAIERAQAVASAAETANDGNVVIGRACR
ncbi:MAG: hypothetical protein ACXVCV_23240 [Polyangia bacterium]